MSLTSVAWLQAMASPDSIVVVGASPHRTNVGSRIVDALVGHGYDGTIVAVHPEATDEPHRGVRWVRSLAEAGKPSLAVVAVPAGRVFDVVDQVDAIGVSTAVIISSGFSEASAEGAELEARIRAETARWKTRLIGPNCSGYISRARSMVSTFTLLLPSSDPRVRAAMRLPPSNSVILSQSGALMAMAARQLWYRGAPPDLAFHCGNGADIDVIDVMEALDPTEPTRIGLYLEGLDASVADRFVAQVDRLSSQGHKVALLKVGRSAQGAAAIQSHTGRIGGDYVAYEAAMRSAGGVIVEDVHALTSVVGWRGRTSTSRAIVLSSSGGMGIWFADRLERAGFDLPAPSPKLVEALRKRVPDFAAVQNPIDVTGTAATDHAILRDAVGIINTSREYDIVYLFHAAKKDDPERGPVATVVPDDFDAATDPALIVTFAGPVDLEDLSAPAGVSVFDDAERAVELGALLRAGAFPKGGPLAPLDLGAARSVDDALAAAGVRRPRRFSIPADQPLEQAALDEAAAWLPGVAKIESPEVPHKEVAGLVKLWLRTGEELREVHAAFGKTLADLKLDANQARFAVEEFVPVKWELLAALRRDPVFGWLFTVGVGGRMVEDVRRTASALAPVSVEACQALVRELFPVSHRRILGMDATLSALSQLGPFLDSQGVAELEINPLGVDLFDRAVALDALAT